MAIVNRAIVAALAAVPEGLLWRFARRYVAGTALAETVQMVRDLNARGLQATLDILGEHGASPADARADALAYRDVLRAIQREGLSSNVSVKPTHMGLKPDPDLCLGTLRELVREAHRLGNFVRLIKEARGPVQRLGVPGDRYEFQMLLGVCPDVRERLRREGERLRIYVPFGEKWRAYCLRRFRGNPEILRHVTLALFRPRS